MIIEHLLKNTIFSINQGRCHSCFSTPRDVLHVLDKDTLIKWIIDHDLHQYEFHHICKKKNIILEKNVRNQWEFFLIILLNLR